MRLVETGINEPQGFQDQIRMESSDQPGQGNGNSDSPGQGEGEPGSQDGEGMPGSENGNGPGGK